MDRSGTRAGKAEVGVCLFEEQRTLCTLHVCRDLQQAVSLRAVLGVLEMVEGEEGREEWEKQELVGEALGDLMLKVGVLRSELDAEELEGLGGRSGGAGGGAAESGVGAGAGEGGC